MSKTPKFSEHILVVSIDRSGTLEFVKIFKTDNKGIKKAEKCFSECVTHFVDERISGLKMESYIDDAYFGNKNGNVTLFWKTINIG